MKHVIFDFDGTLVNSDPLIEDFIKPYIKGTDLTLEKLKDLSTRDFLKALGISKVELPKIIMKVRSEFKSKLKEQQLVEGVVDLLKDLRERSYLLHIVSSNTEDNILEFLELHNARSLFDDVSAFFTVFGKAHGIQKLLRKWNCLPGDAIYVGDETRDIEAAKKVGLPCVAVSWGYNSERILKSYSPDHLARKPSELLEIVNSL